MPIPKGWKRKKIANWKRVCAAGSLRTVRSGKARVLVCCPKGKWKPRAGRCKVGTRAVSVDTPRGGAFGAIGSRTRDRGPMFLTTPHAQALAKLGAQGIGKPTTRKKREFFLRHRLIRPVSGTSGYEVTAKGWASINRTATGSPYFAGRKA